MVHLAVLAWLALVLAGLAAPAPAATIDGGSYHSLALRGGNARVVAWGSNDYGQCTVPIAAQSGVLALAAGHIHNIALKTDGRVVAWGDNKYGQCTPPWQRLAPVLHLLLGN